MRRRGAVDTNGNTSSIPADHREYPEGGQYEGPLKAPKAPFNAKRAANAGQSFIILAAFATLVWLSIIVISTMKTLR